jgi:hypothetical protein
MAIDADPATGPVDPSVARAVGVPFEVSVNITQASTPYQGYQAAVTFDPAVLAYADPPGVTYQGLGGMTFDAPTVVGSGYVLAGSTRPTGTTSATGQAHRIGLQCIAAGTSTLHLVTLGEDPAFGSTTLGAGGATILTTLTDASVTCSACPYPNDTDCDGCTDDSEAPARPNDGLSPLRPAETGGFDPNAWYDFYDVPVPANPDMTPNGTRSRAVTYGDVIAVLFYVGTCNDCPPNANGVDYDSIKGSCDWNADTVPDKEGLCYDRSPGPEPNPPGDAGPPSGAIALTDVLVVLAQFGLDCRP